MYRRSIALCFHLCVAMLFAGQVIAEESGTDSKPVWITSIAPLGEPGQFVAATADGLLLREATVYSFSANNPTAMKSLYTHPAAVWRVDVTSDGGKVASVDYRGNLVVYETGSSKPTTHEKAFERWCQAMMISPDDKSVIAGNEAGKVMAWDLEAGKVTASADLDEHAVTGLAISPDGSQLAATDGGGHVHLLKLPGLEDAGKIQISEETAWCVAFVDGGSHLLVGSSDRNLYRCEAKADAKAESVAKGSDWITQIAVAPSGQVAASEIGGRLHFPSTSGVDSMDAKSGVWTLCWNGDEQLLAGTRKDGIVMAGRSWKWSQPEPPKKEEPQEDAAAEDVTDSDSEEESKEEADKVEADESEQAAEPQEEKNEQQEEKADSDAEKKE